MSTPTLTGLSRDYRVVIFDIETRLTSDEVGWEGLRAGRGGMSAAVVWDSTTQWAHLYDDNPDSLEKLVAHLEAADLVISWSGAQFDVPVVEGLVGRRLRLRAHWDVYLSFKSALEKLGIRVKGSKLGATAERTFGESKTGEGALAPDLAREGRFGELFDYCSQDVRLLFLVVQHLLAFGWLIAPNGQHVSPHVPSALKVPHA